MHLMLISVIDTNCRWQVGKHINGPIFAFEFTKNIIVSVFTILKNVDRNCKAYKC